MAGITYLLRAIPFALISKKIDNTYIKSFLFYLPYAVLSCMTFPAIIYATNYKVAGICAFLVAILFALKGKSLLSVAITACSSVFVLELLFDLIA